MTTKPEKEEKQSPEEGQELVPINKMGMLDPDKQIEFGQKCAKALMRVIKPIEIAGSNYVNFEGWQTVARFFNTTVGIEWTKKVEEQGKFHGYEARAIVYNNGNIISSAEAVCLRDEKNWGSSPEFQLRSMAQTRAQAKALRNVFAWVVVLAGYKATPAEEMEGIQNNKFEDTGGAGPMDKPKVNNNKPASKKQLDLIKSLCKQKGVISIKDDLGIEVEDIDSISSVVASEIIDTLIKYSKKGK